MTAAAPGRPAGMRVKAKLDTTDIDPGAFDMVLSAGNRDRDGEILMPTSWKQPLPDHVPINLGHSADVTDIVGSGRPFIDAKGNLRVRGTFANTERGQHVRKLVNDGHLRGVSVEFLKTKDGNELVGGAFVMVPANPAARVLSSKSATANDGDDGGAPVTLPPPSPEDMVQAVHDASVHLGALCGGAEQQREATAMNRATSQPVQSDDGDSPLGQLQQIMDALEEAEPDDVAALASQAIGVLQQLGGTVPDDGDESDDQDDDLEAKAAALRVRMKMLR